MYSGCRFWQTVMCFIILRFWKMFISVSYTHLCYKITEKTGNVVGVKAVDLDDEIMIINTGGIIIRMKCDNISSLGRVTSGVKLINLPDGETVASIAKVRKGDDEDEEEDTAEVQAENTSEE